MLPSRCWPSCFVFPDFKACFHVWAPGLTISCRFCLPCVASMFCFQVLFPSAYISFQVLLPFFLPGLASRFRFQVLLLGFPSRRCLHLRPARFFLTSPSRGCFQVLLTFASRCFQVLLPGFASPKCYFQVFLKPASRFCACFRACCQVCFQVLLPIRNPAVWTTDV